MMAWAITADEDISVGDGSRDKKKKKKASGLFGEPRETRDRKALGNVRGDFARSGWK